MKNLATLYYNQSLYTKALPLFQSILNIVKDDPTTTTSTTTSTTSTNNSTHNDSSNNDIRIHRYTLLNALSYYGNTQYQLSNYTEAKQTYIEIDNILNKYSRGDVVLRSLLPNNMLNTSMLRATSTTSSPSQRNIYVSDKNIHKNNMNTIFIDNNHTNNTTTNNNIIDIISIISAYDNYAHIYYKSNEHDKALPLFEHVLYLRQSYYNTNDNNDNSDPSILISYKNIGILYYTTKEYTKAIIYFKLCYEGRLRLYGEEHSDVISILGYLGKCI